MPTTSAVPPQRISLSLAKPLSTDGLPVVNRSDEENERIASFLKSTEPDAAKRASHVAAQDQVTAHTVFTVKGKVVGVQQSNGYSLLLGKTPPKLDPERTDGDRSGTELARHRAKKMEDALRSKYGDLLEVHDFSSAADAPTMGQLSPALWHGKTLEETLGGRSGSTGGTSSLLSLSGTSMSLLHGRSR